MLIMNTIPLMNANVFDNGNIARESLESDRTSQLSAYSDSNSDAESASAKRSSPTKNLRELFPGLPENEVQDIAETLHSYCAIVWRMYERLSRECPELIDELMRNRRMKGKVDSSNQ